MREIPLTQGKVALVDDEDYDYLMQWKWCFNKYALRSEYSTGGRTWMHRLIMKTPDGMITDHVNGDRLDNRKANLRIATKSQNGLNRGRPADNLSGYKCVSLNTHGNGWIARTVWNKKPLYIATYDTKAEAYEAYKRVSKFLFGEFANPGEVASCVSD